MVEEAGRAVARIARELGVNEGALGYWVRQDQAGRAGGLAAGERAELAGLRKRVAGLEMERDVLKRSAVLRVNGHAVAAEFIAAQRGALWPRRCAGRAHQTGS